MADSGESGIELAMRLRPSLIFVDVQLGGMDGLAVTGAWRKRSQTPPSS